MAKMLKITTVEPFLLVKVPSNVKRTLVEEYGIFYKMDLHPDLGLQKNGTLDFRKKRPLCQNSLYPKNTSRLFHVETTCKRSFPRRFNAE